MGRSLPLCGTVLSLHLCVGVPDNSPQTVVSNNGQSTTTLWRAVRANREDRVAKLEWASNGGLGRAVIGKVREGRPMHARLLINIYLAERGPDVRPRPP